MQISNSRRTNPMGRFGKTNRERLVMSNTTIQIGDAYRPGIYVLQMRQTVALSRAKLIKTSR